MHFTGKLAGILALALVLGVSGGSASAEKIASGMAHPADFQEILSVIRPANVRQVDQVSRDAFRTFFEQRNRIYNIGPAPADKPVSPEAPPKRNSRNVF